MEPTDTLYKGLLKEYPSTIAVLRAIVSSIAEGDGTSPVMPPHVCPKETDSCYECVLCEEWNTAMFSLEEAQWKREYEQRDKDRIRQEVADMWVPFTPECVISREAVVTYLFKQTAYKKHRGWDEVLLNPNVVLAINTLYPGMLP